MKSPTPPFIPLDRSLDGARVLWRHFLSARPPLEGWVREFSADARLVRISKTKYEDGTWHRCYDLRVEAVLEWPEGGGA